MIPDMPDRAEEAAGASAAVARCGYLIRYIIRYLIFYRIRYSPSAATLTDVSTLTEMAEQLALGRERRRRRTTRRRRRTRQEDEEKKKKEKEKAKVRMDGGRLGRQEKGSRKM
jgi:hypothetical protein